MQQSTLSAIEGAKCSIKADKLGHRWRVLVTYLFIYGLPSTKTSPFNSLSSSPRSFSGTASPSSSRQSASSKAISLAATRISGIGFFGSRPLAFLWICGRLAKSKPPVTHYRVDDLEIIPPEKPQK
jgi:hypothetical protein